MPKTIDHHLRLNRGFDPSWLSGLALWLDAADAGTITLDGSNNVSQWTDKSGNGRNLSQSTTLNRPGYTGGDGITFTSAGHALTNSTSFTTNAAISLFLAFRPTDVSGYSTAGSDTLFQFSGWRFKTSAFNAWGTYFVDREGVVSNVLDVSDLIKIADRVMSAVCDATATKPRLIGSTTRNYSLSASLSGSPNAVTIGTFPRGNMVIREAIVYNSALSDTNRKQVEDYLVAKWGT